MADNLRKRREQREMTQHETTAEGVCKKAKPTPLSKLDFTSIVISSKLHTPAQVMRHAKQGGSLELQA